MSEKKNIYPSMPSAPTGNVGNNDFFQHRGPPPTYEDSQRPDVRPPPPSYFSSVNTAQINGSQSYQYRSFVAQPSPPYPGNVNSSMPGHSFTNAQTLAGGYNVVEFDAGARFKGRGAGSISVPPPPPGYAPTPAQLAALQGHPVVRKKKKNSFF